MANLSATWWESKLAQRLDFVAAIAAILVVCRLALLEDISWVAWMVAGAFVVLLALARWPYGALIVLIASSVTPRFFIEIVGWKARPEHFAVALISVIVGVWLLRHKGEVRLQKLDYWVIAYVALNYFSSAFRSSEPSATLRWALQNNLAVLPYFLIRFLVRDVETLRKAFRILLAVAFVESAYGIFCFASHHAFGTMIGMDWQYFGDVAAPYGTLYEPNIFGAYTACLAVLFLSLYLGNGRHRFACMAGFVVASLATVLSLSRAVLIAFVFALLWIVRKTRQANRHWNWRVIILVPAAVLVLLLMATPIRAVLQERFGNLISQGLAEETTITRYIAIAGALQDIPAHPLLGSGTASFQLSFDWAKYVPDWTNTPTWVGNVVVRIVHDTGLVGLVLVLGFLLSVWRQVRQDLRRRTHETPILLGLWAGTLLYCITFESTDGSMLAFTWIHLGLLASAAILVSDPKLNSQAAAAQGN